MKIPEIKRGQYVVIPADGALRVVDQKPTLKALYLDLGCDTIDTVLLDRERQIVMVVDDVGMVENRPVNALATAIVALCAPRGTHTVCAIHGDVAIVNDEDFE